MDVNTVEPTLLNVSAITLCSTYRKRRAKAKTVMFSMLRFTITKKPEKYIANCHKVTNTKNGIFTSTVSAITKMKSVTSLEKPDTPLNRQVI